MVLFDSVSLVRFICTRVVGEFYSGYSVYIILVHDKKYLYISYLRKTRRSRRRIFLYE